MRAARIAYGLLVAAWVLVSGPALGQRIQFATPVQLSNPPAGPTYAAPPGWPPAGAPATPPALPPGAPVVTTPAPPGALALPAPPGVTLGTIQPPGPTWDPYATQGAGPQPGLMTQDPYLPPGQIPWMGPMFTQMRQRLLTLSLDYHWFSGSGSKDNELGINDVELKATFGLPFLPGVQTAGLEQPLLITPGFAFHFWSGPKSVPTPGGYIADMPPITYDAYLDTAWNPQITPWFGGELDFQIGVFSDFDEFAMDSLRFKGRGLIVLTMSPSFKIKGGIWYLDRVRYKMLPAGGVVWTPNPVTQDTRFEILFPNPKFIQKLSVTGTTEWWWYISGDYGGGVWTIKRASVAGIPPAEQPEAGSLDLVDYNDIRIALGLEFKRMAGLGLNGLIEIGYAFNRELVYRSGYPSTFEPNDTVFLRAGLTY